METTGVADPVTLIRPRAIELGTAGQALFMPRLNLDLVFGLAPAQEFF